MRREMLPINVIGSSKFGVYPKISIEKTYNLYESDGWMINYYGYQKKVEISTLGEGRGFFYSTRGNFAIAVIGSAVWRIEEGLTYSNIGNVSTLFGEISIDENLSGQIAICDGEKLYIYQYTTAPETFTEQALTNASAQAITPGYVTYQNTYFIITPAFSDLNNSQWHVFEYGTDTTITRVGTFSLQTKPDYCRASVRIPGGGNNILILGTTVAEVWTQVAVDVYRRVSSFNIDHGIGSINTLASDSHYVMWLARNEKNKYFINLMQGTQVRKVSTDGIDHLIENLTDPTQSTAFFYQQDGHLFYQITFFHEDDNISLFYDVSRDAFYHTCDEHWDYHPARQVINFNGIDYFVSINDGSIYEMSSNYTTYNYTIADNDDGEEDDGHDSGFVIPRRRVCKTLRFDDGNPFRALRFHVWIEQGITDFPALYLNEVVCYDALEIEGGGDFIYTESGELILGEEGVCAENVARPSVDLSFSKNGNISFSNIVRKYLNPQGDHQNQLQWYNLCYCNEVTVQLDFHGLNRFVVGPGNMEVGR